MANHNRAYLELLYAITNAVTKSIADVIIRSQTFFCFNLANESSPTQINEVFESFEYHDILRQ